MNYWSQLMTGKLKLAMLLLVASGLSVTAEKRNGRAEPGIFSVPEDVHYEVKTYREGPHLRAGLVGVAVAQEHLGTDAKLPVVIFIHGGGWKNGDKDQLAWQCIRYAQDGYVAVTVSYRLIDEAPFPACIQDVMEAVRYIKSICPEYSGDPENIGLQGYSAGAHLALLTALASDEMTFHSGAYPEFDSKVKCAFVISAPTDFVERRKREGPLKMLNGEQNENRAFLERISPVSYVAAGQVPIMMLHGTEDPWVPSYHYLDFQKRCEGAGVANFELVTHPGGGHMFFFKQRETYQPIMDGFFAKHLLHPPAGKRK
jgi:acetyl esterase/lipase